MSYEMKDNSFTVFPNRRKEKDTHPDFTGSIKIGGQERWFNMWQKQDKNGNVYFSGTVGEIKMSRERVNKPAPKPLSQQAAAKRPKDDLDDEIIPF